MKFAASWLGLIIAAALLFAPSSGWATDVPLAKQLDFNGDGKLEETEVLAGLLNKDFAPNYNLKRIQELAKTKVITLVDLGLQGPGSTAFDTSNVWTDYDTAVALKGKKDSNGQVYFNFADFDPVAQFGLKQEPKPKPGQEPSPTSPGTVPAPPLAQTTKPPAGYQLKSTLIKLFRSTTDLTPGVSGTSQSAFLSYSKTTTNGNNSLLAQGVLAADFDIEDETLTDPVSVATYDLEGFHVMPSIAFDKATEQNPSTNNVDSLNYNLGLSSLWEPENNSGISAAVTTTLTYATDFEMRSEIPSAQVDLVPIKNKWSLGSDTPLFGISAIDVNTLFDLHLEAGDVVDKGDSTTLKNNTGYLRGGPQLGFTFTPSDNRTYDLGALTFSPSDVSLNVSYLYYARALGPDANAHLLQSSISWAVGGSQNLSLKLEYDNGVTPIQLQDKHLLTVGLGIKFP